MEVDWALGFIEGFDMGLKVGFVLGFEICLLVGRLVCFRVGFAVNIGIAGGFVIFLGFVCGSWRSSLFVLKKERSRTRVGIGPVKPIASSPCIRSWDMPSLKINEKIATTETDAITL